MQPEDVGHEQADVDEVKKRAFLRLAGAGVLAMLIDGTPTTVSVEGLAVARAQLDALRAHSLTVSRSGIAIPVTQQAERLVRLLRETPESSKLYRQVAEVTAETAMLTGYAVQDLGEDRTAERWGRVAIEVSGRARNPDLLAMAMEDQAWIEWDLGNRDAALTLLDKMPLRALEPGTRASVEIGRANLLARASRQPDATAHARTEHRREAMNALKQVAEHAGRPAAPGRLPVDARRVVHVRGQTLVELQLGDEAYVELAGLLRGEPLQWRIQGMIEKSLAVAAAQQGDVDQAVAHAVAAHEIFVAHGSTYQDRQIVELRATTLAPFADTAAVRRLDEQLRARAVGGMSQYEICRSRGGGWGLHLKSCPYLRRGSPGRERRPWHGGAGRDPADVARDPAIRARFHVCKSCLPPS